MLIQGKGFNPSSFRKLVVGIDKRIPLASGKSSRYINLDNAASTPTLYPVMDRLNEFMDWYSSVHRGTGFKSMVSTQVYDHAHEIVGRFVNANPVTNTVIFVKNTTEAINKLSYRLGLSKNDIVITTTMEHHSNDLPWRSKAQVVYISVNEDGSLNYHDLEDKIKAHRNRLKLVAVSGASNVTGYKNDIHRIASLAHRAGAPVFVDAAQLAPHSPVDMKPDGHPEHIDYLAFSAHKIYAPFGTGVLIGPKRTFERGCPEYSGGGTIKIVTHSGVEWAPLPDKEEAGSPNVVGGVALAIALEYLRKLGMDRIEEYEKSLTSYTLQKLKEIKGITIYGENDPQRLDNRVGVITFNLKGIPHSLVASALAWEGGIAVRNGCFCAHPYILKLLNLSDEQVSMIQHRIRVGDRSEIPGMVRISLAAYNNKRDIDRTAAILHRINGMAESGELSKRYELSRETGSYRPVDVEVKFDRFFSFSR
ncbi:MAG: Cysteine desulfurase [Firmicutes bacterium]|nr:Cysteine desulfurase [Bacillota bacterium]MDI6706342.1 aminotransferase class V-fold PLP-dependent enzyme [Bacillota bacterium]